MTKIEEIEEALTTKDMYWAVEQMKAGHTVKLDNPESTRSKRLRWKVVGTDVYIYLEKWEIWGSPVQHGVEDWIRSHSDPHDRYVLDEEEKY